MYRVTSTHLKIQSIPLKISGIGGLPCLLLEDRQYERDGEWVKELKLVALLQT
jgi:hypothetical protein